MAVSRDVQLQNAAIVYREAFNYAKSQKAANDDWAHAFARTMLAIASGESNLDNAVERKTDRTDPLVKSGQAQPEHSVGLFQLNYMGGRGNSSGLTPEQAKDPTLNTRASMPDLWSAFYRLGGYNGFQNNPEAFTQQVHKTGQVSVLPSIVNQVRPGLAWSANGPPAGAFEAPPPPPPAPPPPPPPEPPPPAADIPLPGPLPDINLPDVPPLPAPAAPPVPNVSVRVRSPQELAEIGRQIDALGAPPEVKEAILAQIPQTLPGVPGINLPGGGPELLPLPGRPEPGGIPGIIARQGDIERAARDVARQIPGLEDISFGAGTAYAAEGGAPPAAPQGGGGLLGGIGDIAGGVVDAAKGAAEAAAGAIGGIIGGGGGGGNAPAPPSVFVPGSGAAPAAEGGAPAPEGGAPAPAPPAGGGAPAAGAPTGPNGRTVEQIRGTQYKSPEERNWYFAQQGQTPPPLPVPERRTGLEKAVQTGENVRRVSMGAEPIGPAMSNMTPAQRFYSQAREIRGPTSALGQPGELAGVNIPTGPGASRFAPVGDFNSGAGYTIRSAGLIPTGDAAKDMATAAGIDAMRANLLSMPGATPLSVQTMFDAANRGTDVFSRAKSVGAEEDAARQWFSAPKTPADQITGADFRNFVQPGMLEEELPGFQEGGQVEIDPLEAQRQMLFPGSTPPLPAPTAPAAPAANTVGLARQEPLELPLEYPNRGRFGTRGGRGGFNTIRRVRDPYASGMTRNYEPFRWPGAPTSFNVISSAQDFEDELTNRLRSAQRDRLMRLGRYQDAARINFARSWMPKPPSPAPGLEEVPAFQEGGQVQTGGPLNGLAWLQRMRARRLLSPPPFNPNAVLDPSQIVDRRNAPPPPPPRVYGNFGPPRLVVFEDGSAAWQTDPYYEDNPYPWWEDPRDIKWRTDMWNRDYGTGNPGDPSLPAVPLQSDGRYPMAEGFQTGGAVQTTEPIVGMGAWTGQPRFTAGEPNALTGGMPTNETISVTPNEPAAPMPGAGMGMPGMGVGPPPIAPPLGMPGAGMGMAPAAPMGRPNTLDTLRRLSQGIDRRVRLALPAGKLG